MAYRAGFRAIRRTSANPTYRECCLQAHRTVWAALKCDPGADWIECPHGRDAATCHDCDAERRR